MIRVIALSTVILLASCGGKSQQSQYETMVRCTALASVGQGFSHLGIAALSKKTDWEYREVGTLAQQKAKGLGAQLGYPEAKIAADISQQSFSLTKKLPEVKAETLILAPLQTCTDQLRKGPFE